MSLGAFVEAVAGLSFENAFNPYRDCCPVHDKPHAPAGRLALLRSMLEVASDSGVEAVWVGRDYGYRGGRRTGLAFTDDEHVEHHAARWGVRAVHWTTSRRSERSASVVWRELSRIESPIFLWNVFPMHPHEPKRPLSNRAHNKVERKAGEHLLAELLTLLRPSRIVAIGVEAQRSCRRVAALPIVDCRHPSHGGANLFREQVLGAYQANHGLRAV
jgi:hypothetical protein